MPAINSSGPITVEPIGTDTITPDIPLRLRGATWAKENPELYLFRDPPDSESLDFVESLGRLNRATNWRAGKAREEYEVHTVRDPKAHLPHFKKEEIGLGKTRVHSYTVKSGQSGSDIDATESGFVRAGAKESGADSSSSTSAVAIAAAVAVILVIGWYLL